METKGKEKSPLSRLLLRLFALLLMVLCLWQFVYVAPYLAAGDMVMADTRSNLSLAASYTRSVNNFSAAALDGLLHIDKVYWLAEDAVVAPAPRQDAYGSTQDPAEAAAVVEQAAPVLGGQETIWRADLDFMPGKDINWYLDDSLLVLTWKQVIDNLVYTFTEVKVAHPSQFRRYLADDSFASPHQYRPTEMADTVQAVAALSADFYKFRNLGIVVYHRNLYRADGESLDTCFVNASGDLLFVRRGELSDEAAILRYIEENDVLFSLAFGPIILENGENVLPTTHYPVGQITENYSRCAICQAGECHYLLVTINGEDRYWQTGTLSQMADGLLSLGVEKAYALDGGQTASMILRGELINHVDWGEERTMSDILYFATAIPEGG